MSKKKRNYMWLKIKRFFGFSKEVTVEKVIEIKEDKGVYKLVNKVKKVDGSVETVTSKAYSAKDFDAEVLLRLNDNQTKIDKIKNKDLPKIRKNVEDFTLLRIKLDVELRELEETNRELEKNKLK